MCECKDCGVTKARIRCTEITNRLAFKDESGSAWNGRQCPECRKTANFARWKKRQAKHVGPPKELLGPKQPLQTAKLRSCGDCGRKTPNYSRCEPCHLLHIRQHDYLYHGGYEEGMFETHFGNDLGTFSRGAGFRY